MGTDLERGGDKRAVKVNRRIEARIRTERKLFEDLYAEVTGANRIPVNMALAQTMSDVRHGSAPRSSARR
jgi:hypothetical protein